MRIYKLPAGLDIKCGLEFSMSDAEEIHVSPSDPGYDDVNKRARDYAPGGYPFRTNGIVYVAFYEETVN